VAQDEVGKDCLVRLGADSHLMQWSLPSMMTELRQITTIQIPDMLQGLAIQNPLPVNLPSAPYNRTRHARINV
jgi:hypothetical protein